MKKISALKLNQLSKAELEAKLQDVLKGGDPGDSSCVCNCASETANANTRGANSSYGYQYSYGGDYSDNCYCSCQSGIYVPTMAGVRYLTGTNP
jgi:natural product precursor